MPASSPAPVPGSTALPSGFPHPHASEEARAIAENGMILRVQVGSGVHGTSITGQDDRDEMGLCLEPPQFVTGLARVPDGTGGLAPSVRFEQYERHTAWDRPGGIANRSGAGDLDVIIYSARKWARLALAGNPTVLLVLFVPVEEVVFRNEAGAELAGNAHRFVSRLAASRYLGCSAPGASRCPFPNRIARTCAPSAGVSGHSARSWRRSATPRHGWPRCETARPSPISRTAAGPMTGCTAAT
jgi:hypothetical protein